MAQVALAHPAKHPLAAWASHSLCAAHRSGLQAAAGVANSGGPTTGPRGGGRCICPRTPPMAVALAYFFTFTRSLIPRVP